MSFRKIFVTILIITLSLFCSTASAKNEEESQSIISDSIDQLVVIIKDAIKEKNTNKLEKIKRKNALLIQNNMFPTIKKCDETLLHEIKTELSDEKKTANDDPKISQILADIYKDATKSSYLVNKVAFLCNLNINDKKKYMEMLKLYSDAFKAYRKYHYDLSVEYLKKNLSLCNELGFKEGKANNLNMTGKIHKLTSQYDNAFNEFEECLKIYKEIGSQQGQADTLIAIGDLLVLLDKNEDAQAHYTESLKISRIIKNELTEAQSLHGLGSLSIGMITPENSIQMLLDALKLYKKVDDSIGICLLHIDLGDIYMGLSNYGEAQKNYEECLNISRKVNDKKYEAFGLKSLGDSYILLSDYEKARKYYRESLSLFIDIKDFLGQANTLLSLGEIYSLLDEYPEAISKFNESLEIFRNIKNSTGEAQALINLGYINLKLTEHEKAYKNFVDSKKIFKNIKNTPGEAYSLLGLGEYYLRLAEYKNAQKHFEESLDLYKQVNSLLGIANCIFNLGETYFRINDKEKALKCFKECLSIYKNINIQLGIANSYLRIGFIYRTSFEFNEAIKNYLFAIKIYYHSENQLGISQSLIGLGDCYRGLSKSKISYNAYYKGLSIQKRVGDHYGMSMALNTLGQCYEVDKKFDKSAICFKRSIHLAESMLNAIKVESNKISYFSSLIGPYENLINLLFKIHKPAEAFSYAERSKARSFLYLLGNKHIDLEKGISPELANEEKELRRQINVLTSKLINNEEKEPEKRAKRDTSDQWNDELLKLKQKHSETLEKIKLNSPEYASLLTVNPLSLKEIQSLIKNDKNTTLIEYYSTPDHLFMWLLDGKHIHSYKINISQKSLDSLIKEYTSMISNSNTNMNEIGPRAQKLYNLLLKPFEKYLNNKSYIAIVPHNTLHYLPFETLMNNKKFLAEQDFKIFYLPSASVYKYCKEKNLLNKKSITTFVNPDGSLPYSETETKSIQQLFSPENTKIISGKNATESEAKNSMGNTDIIHFACHGSFESNHPLYSALLLNPDKDNDGRLETSEIFQLKLKPAYLVTLSACETHMGSISPGDEIIGLTRAFIYAGTPSILASLWKIDDEFTGKLMESFYKNLQITNKIDALHSARTQMITEYGKRHPFYWASFVLIGDPK